MFVAFLARAEIVVDGTALADERNGANWLSYGRTYSEQHYSPLKDINSGNVRQLGLAWFLDLPGQRTLEATPLAVDGVLYFSGTNGKAFAVDARTGRELWEYDPDPAHHSPQKLRMHMGAHRGVAYWHGKVYTGTVDGRLIAFDAKTGTVVWSVQTFDDPQARKAISGAPRVFNGKVLIGHGGGDVGTRGYVTAYDTESGKQLWRFYTVPGDPTKGFENAAMAMAAKTWTGQWWHWGGGGAVWNSITYDPEFNRVYLGTGNGNDILEDVASRGEGNSDNLFGCSIVALDADTGKYIWHYQTTPGDLWDFDATQDLVLANLRIKGQSRKVLMQANKNGFFYVIDRVTGKLVSAEKFVKVTWAERVDLKTARPVETLNLRNEKGSQIIWPSSVTGAHDWQPMSFNPGTGLVYIPTMKLGMPSWPLTTEDDLKDFDNDQRRYFFLGGLGGELIRQDSDDGTGGLLAWNPVTQKKRWEVRYADSYWNGGTLTTGGNLVFQGTARGQFIAYDASTGDKLWSFDAGLGIIGTPIAYEIDGIQFVSILIGYGGTAGIGGKLFDLGWRFNEQPRRLLTFALSRKTPLPPGGLPRYRVNAVDDDAFVIDEKEAAYGLKLFQATCMLCHGAELEGTGSIAPDLRESVLAMNWEAFRSVLHEGRLTAAGMPMYDDLTDDDMHAIFTYIRRRAREAAQSSR